MAYELREGSGSLFKNKHKEKDSQPNARGEAKIGGVVYEISAWTKRDKNGEPWQSLAIKPKEERESKPQKTGTFADMSDDIPFLDPYKFSWRCV